MTCSSIPIGYRPCNLKHHESWLFLRPWHPSGRWPFFVPRGWKVWWPLLVDWPVPHWPWPSRQHYIMCWWTTQRWLCWRYVLTYWTIEPSLFLGNCWFWSRAIFTATSAIFFRIHFQIRMASTKPYTTGSFTTFARIDQIHPKNMYIVSSRNSHMFQSENRFSAMVSRWVAKRLKISSWPSWACCWPWCHQWKPRGIGICTRTRYHWTRGWENWASSRVENHKLERWYHHPPVSRSYFTWTASHQPFVLTDRSRRFRTSPVAGVDGSKLRGGWWSDVFEKLKNHGSNLIRSPCFFF